jgi:sialidase-1
VLRPYAVALFVSLVIVSGGASVFSQSKERAGPATTEQATTNNFEVMLAPLVANKRYGAPTLVQLKGGEILAAYNDWTMPGDNSDFSPAFVGARISRDGGRSWGRPFVLQENTSQLGRMGPPTLLRLRNGDIGFFSAELNSYSNFSFFFKRSHDEGKSWSAPTVITPKPGYYIMNNHRVIQLKSQRLLAPFSYIPDIKRSKEFTWEGVCHYSDDNGATWREGKGRVRIPDAKLDEFGLRTGVQEPGLIELKDGSVMMIIRNQHQRVFKSYSKDGGDTWSAPERIEQLIAPVSPATIMRIPTTGDLAIVWNYSPKLRTPLAIAISRDEGKTWGNVKFLEVGYFSYSYIAFLFPEGSQQLLLCYWVDETRDRPNKGVGLRIKSLDINWLYQTE